MAKRAGILRKLGRAISKEIKRTPRKRKVRKVKRLKSDKRVSELKRKLKRLRLKKELKLKKKKFNILHHREIFVK